MKYKFEDYWGSGRLVAEDKSYIAIPQNGILVKIGNMTGKLYSLPDVSSHNGGHGMGSMTSCQGVISPADMSLGVIKSSWGSIFDIEVLE